MQKVIFPGSFDPVTNGHLNVIDRATKLFDKVEVVISVNPQKQYLFSVEERFDMMEKLTAHYDNVHISVWDKLIVDFAKKIDTFLIIGLFRRKYFQNGSSSGGRSPQGKI